MKTTYKSTVELIDSMGDDLTIINAAKVSFDKESCWLYKGEGGDTLEYLDVKDAKLIKYLADNNHWSPFAHTAITLRVTAPIFVARQLVKHQVGGVWNEVSRRYVDYEPVFYFPDKWRKRAENVKQGSSDEAVDVPNGFLESRIELLNVAYQELLENDVAPEQARMILPQNMMTSWYWTGSLIFFHRVFKQRTDSHAQLETQEVALQIGEICAKLFPISWKYLNNL